MTESLAVNFGNSAIINRTKKVTYQEEISTAVPPYADLSIKIEKRRSHSYLDFAAIYRVTGQVVMVMHDVFPKPDYDKPLGEIGDHVKDPTITLRGQILNASSQDTMKSTRLVKYTETTCPG